MVHVVYDVNAAGHFFNVQSGGGDSPFFEGVRFQRGYGRQHGNGVLGVFRRALRYLKPIAQRILPLAKEYITPMANEAMKAIADEGLDAGQKILAGIAQGGDSKDAVVTEGTKALKNLVKRAGVSLQQKGKGKKRKAPRSVSNLHLVGRSVLASAAKKKRLKNTLGLY